MILNIVNKKELTDYWKKKCIEILKENKTYKELENDSVKEKRTLFKTIINVFKNKSKKCIVKKQNLNDEILRRLNNIEKKIDKLTLERNKDKRKVI